MSDNPFASPSERRDGDSPDPQSQASAQQPDGQPQPGQPQPGEPQYGQAHNGAPQPQSAPAAGTPVAPGSAYGASAPQSGSQASAPGSDPQYDTEVIDRTQVPVAGAAAAMPGAMAPAADGTFSTAAPAYDASGYVAPPAAPAPKKEKRARVGKGAVAGIAAGALLLGLGGGVLGAWGYDEYTAPPQAQLSTSTAETVDREAGSVAAVAAEAMPSTVSIEASAGQLGSSTGSGFVIREDGYILTNNHVVEGADSITVIFSDGSEYPAELVGATGDYDIAVLQVELTGLTPLVFADSDEVVVGDETIAVGSPLGLEATVTTGIVSSLHRPVRAGEITEPAFIDAIQTDAAINPGNSGGPLLNANGEVIGVNSAIATLSTATDTTGSIGLGFAITSNQAKRTAEELIETGQATYPIIGVLLDDTYTGEGVKVLDDPSGVSTGSPAAEAGIEPGDVITAIDGRPITQVDELIVSIRAQAPGDEVVLTVLRDNEEQDITVSLASSATLNAQQG
ncbi:S1C family serine protease [Demequina flava]|uniref:S1C family serine protease n=1 Tax=Demequina flava TaxID=1095025 RepID=UPI000783E337|nr:trypsin-like peptidase domain-containing protein [Demequina flava]